MSGKTILWSSTSGDVTFPITPTSMDSMTVGATTPEPGTFTNLHATGTTQMDGAVSGAGFTAAVQALIEGEAPAVRYLPLTDAKSDAGVGLTASATGGAMGVSRTAGTSLVLVGETTSSNAKTDKALWEFNLPSTYVSGSTVPVIVNANYTGTGTVTAASTTITVNAYTEVNGVETALTGITAAQQFTNTAANYTFTIPATGLAIGTHLVVEIVMLVTTSANAATGQINSVGYTA